MTQPVCPVQCSDVERRVVLGQVRVAARCRRCTRRSRGWLTSAAGHEEARLHPSSRAPTPAPRGRPAGAAAARRSSAAGRRPVGRVGQRPVGLPAARRLAAAAGAKVCRGHGQLVVGDRQAALGDVEDAGGGAAVVRGVVQHAVDEAVAAQQRRAEVVAVERQRQLAGQAGLVEHQGAAGQLGLLAGIGQVVVEEGLDAVVGGAQPVGQAAAELTLAGEDRAGRAGRRRCPRTPRGGAGPSWARRRLMAAFWVWWARLDCGPRRIGAATGVRERAVWKADPRASTWRTGGCVMCAEGGLEPPCPIRALAPQASASANSATRTSDARPALGRPSCDRERYTLGGPEPKSRTAAGNGR